MSLILPRKIHYQKLRAEKNQISTHILQKNMWLCEIRGLGQGVKYSGVYHSNPPCLLLCDYLIKTGLNFSWGHLGNLPGEWKYNTEKINKGAGEGGQGVARGENIFWSHDKRYYMQTAIFNEILQHRCYCIYKTSYRQQCSFLFFWLLDIFTHTTSPNSMHRSLIQLMKITHKTQQNFSEQTPRP